MNIDELRSVQSKERQKSDLQQLRESFYGDVAAYIEELEAERERVASNAEDPFGSPAVQQLTNDIETAKDTAEAIYERRLGKIVKKASLVSAEMANPDDVNGLTAEEQALFADLVARIEANKEHMLDVIAGDAPAGSPAPDIEVANTASDGLEEAVEGAPSSDTTSAKTPGAVDPEAGLTGDAPGDAEDHVADDAPNDASGGAPSDASGDVTDGAPDDPPVPDDVLAGGDPEAEDESVPAADVMGETDTAESETANGDAAGDDGGDAGESAAADAPERTDGGAVAESNPDQVDSTDASPSASGDDASAVGAAVDADRATLRVTEDVGEIFGVDEREYTLQAEDVVTLPEENADVLLTQGAAERLD